jgi:peptide methionine sulfoxide reductase MsrA
MMSNQMGIYYSNCAMVAVSPRDISLFFGRFTPVSDNKGNQALGELYERQIYMTVEQAEDLVRMLTQTLQAFKARKRGSGTQEKKE